ncbi:MAG: 5-formyltetrahydrofolate cyclo-ligase [Deltaproteobacteria bacterium]|nr:5-formyltetrahydrofolate cyclo-ligase [Deltaproteobacteria bacterium]
MNPTKKKIRESIWRKLTEAKVGAFPFPLDGRIPNFKGASEAAELLSELEIWQSAKTIKANPDAPQRPVREKALRDGKRLFMAVPRLRDEKPFRELNPEKIIDIKKAVAIKGGMNLGIPTSVEQLPPIDLIIAGSVAVNKDGRRLGKGGGYSDLEFALASHYGKITDKTLIVTTVHPLQITDQDIPMERHDIPVDFIITSETVIATNTRYPRPSGIFPEILSEDYIENIPVIAKLLGY